MKSKSSTTSPKHALLICRVWGSHHGGSIYSQALLLELQKRDWPVTILAERFDSPVQNGIQLRGFFRRDPFAWPMKALETIKLCRLAAARGALMIVQGDLPRATYLLLQFLAPLIFIRQDGILACPANHRFLSSTRSICTRRFGLSCLAHRTEQACLGELKLTRKLGRLTFRFRDQLLLAGIRHFICNSQYIAHVHQQPARVLYPPLLSTGPASTGTKRDLKTIVFCGRLEDLKGAAEAVKILSLLPDDYHLEILGDGPQHSRLERQAHECRLQSRIRFHGWVTPETRDSCLAHAGVLLLPSLCDEAFGMTGLEALAQGTPVVAYDVGGISEWCREPAGIRVRCGDVVAAAVAVARLTQDPARWRIHSQAAAQLAQKISLPAVSEGISTKLFHQCNIIFHNECSLH